MILLVEDNPADTILAVNTLDRSNLANEVISFETAEETLDYLAKAAALPILALVDLALPQMDGLEFIQRARHDSRLKALPIVILTERDGDEETFAEAGADAFLHKPLTAEKLMGALRDLKLRWQIVR